MVKEKEYKMFQIINKQLLWINENENVAPF